MRKYVLISTAFLIIGAFAAYGFKNGQDSSNFDERAIVVLGYLDWKQNVPSKFLWPRVAFAIGDGTLLLTAAHCVDDYNVALDEPVSVDAVVISPYYGDIYDFEIVAIDKKADLAILKASWSSHPALKIATEEEFEAAKNILIASRPQANDDKSFHVGRNIKNELLPIIYKQSQKPSTDLRLEGAKQVAPGWSGSPLLIPNSDKVAGVLTSGIVGIKIKRLFGLITTTRNDAAGCNLQSIQALIKKSNLESAAYAPAPKLKDIPDAKSNFNLAMDFFEKMFTGTYHEQFKITSDFLERKPESLQAHLLHAFSATVMGHDPNNDRNSYFSQAEESYKKALQLDPNNSHTHAAYGGFLKISKRDSEALEQSNLSLAIDPNNRMALFNKLMILGPTERKEVAEQLLAIEPNNARVLFYYSWALSGIGENEKALEVAQKVLEIDPNGMYYGALAEALVNLGKYDEAEQYYKLKTEKCGCYSCWCKYAKFLVEYRTNRFDEATKAIEKSRSLARMHNLPEDEINFVEIRLLEKTEPERAEAFIRELLDTSPDNGYYWFFLANFLNTTKKFEDSKIAMEKAESLPQIKNISIESRNTLKLVVYEKTDPNKAEALAKELVEALPDKGNYWYIYSGILKTLEKYPQAVEAAQKAVDLSPEKSYQPRLANCLAKAGELEKAEKVYDEMHEAHPENYSYWFWYAEFLVDYFDNRIDEAKEALEKVPYNPEKEKNVTPDDIKKLWEKINKK